MSKRFAVIPEINPINTAVIGGGIVGRSIALALAGRGERVALIDPAARPAAASWGNAGHIATEQVAPLASRATIASVPRRLALRGGPLALPWRQAGAWAPFVWRLLGASGPERFAAGKAALGDLLAGALPAWERLVAIIGAPQLLRQDGHFVAWESAATAAAGRAAWAAADIGSARFADAGAADLARLRALAPGIAGAIRFAGTGQIADLDALAAALDAALAAAGVRRIERAAVLERRGSGMAVRGIDARRIVVAAGAASGELLAAAGHRVPLIAERGYHLRAAADPWPADLPPVAFEDRSVIVTRYAAQVQVAGFVELGYRHAPPDPCRWARLERHVAELELPVAGPFSRWMGARPTLPDYLPAIGRSGHADNLFYAFGHQHLGLTLGPVTGEIVADMLAGEAGDLSAFALDRFARKRT